MLVTGIQQGGCSYSIEERVRHWDVAGVTLRIVFLLEQGCTRQSWRITKRCGVFLPAVVVGSEVSVQAYSYPRLFEFICSIAARTSSSKLWL